ncbi:S-layer homology domain-containing protein [Vallitalea guaymasensis]|uniref:S-layer homology domain-containing protein n=1 Tax=Vallitalea guaymasensis TaxID=1185412 RepID=UPI000DE49C1E|nr:S-layer homology domain-containing protein [Vallitalea guaymasensis]
MKLLRKGISALLIFTMLLSFNSYVLATSTIELDAAIIDTGKYIYKTVKSPQVGSIGGEWAVLGLARSGYDIPDKYYKNYYKTVENYVKACKGILHKKKYTEYSRLIVALTSIGKDPSDVGGYNLLTALGDYDKTIWQGMNGPIWALIALDSGNYPMPKNKNAKVQATRDMYINRILECQLVDGGWSLFGGTTSQSIGDSVSDPDITGMALQALAKYQYKSEVKKACEEALACMSKMQNSQGGFSSWGTANSESCVQMLVALCELGISVDDRRFVKNGNTMFDNLMTFYNKGNGFLHTKNGSGSNQMATEQGFYGLIAVQRALKGRESLYRMRNKLDIGETSSIANSVGLENKHKDIKKLRITKMGKTFKDIKGHENQSAIEALASREIINGKTKDLFEPDATMTRGEFASIIVKALGLKPKAIDNFIDVKKDKWYAGYIGTANTYGIISGKSTTTYAPNAIITREEAAVVVTRAAKLCGMNTQYNTMAARDILSQFIDYVKVNKWARQSLAFCYDKEILDSSTMEILPEEPIKRCEIARMIYNMLYNARLL